MPLPRAFAAPHPSTPDGVRFTMADRSKLVRCLVTASALSKLAGRDIEIVDYKQAFLVHRAEIERIASRKYDAASVLYCRSRSRRPTWCSFSPVQSETGHAALTGRIRVIKGWFPRLNFNCIASTRYPWARRARLLRPEGRPETPVALGDRRRAHRRPSVTSLPCTARFDHALGCYNDANDLTAFPAVNSPFMSERTVRIQGIEYVRSRDAARLVRLAADYVSRLAREDLIDGRQVDGLWFVNIPSLKAFLIEQDRQKEIWRAHLARIRREEQRQAGHRRDRCPPRHLRCSGGAVASTTAPSSRSSSALSKRSTRKCRSTLPARSGCPKRVNITYLFDAVTVHKQRKHREDC